MANTNTTQTPKPKPVAAVAPPAFGAQIRNAQVRHAQSSTCRSSKCRKWKCRPPSASLPRKASRRPRKTTRRSRARPSRPPIRSRTAYTTASSGCSGYGLKLIETARTNSNAAFDLYGELLGAKSYSEVVEKTTAYMRTQFDTMTAQAKELTEHAQKVATDTAEPIKESISTLGKAA